jgi:[acyl-carrier-protein] S-malonyltransferase
MKKHIFLFPGQGAQYQGMGLDFLEHNGEGLFTLASDIVGKDLRLLLRDSNEETLKRSDISQPAITLVNLAAAAYLKERGIQAAGAAGFSLGEYAALVIAEVISAEDCFRLVKLRGEAMQATADRIGHGEDAPGMAAVIGLPADVVERLIVEAGIGELYAANINSKRQVVVSGTASALAAAGPLFKNAGAKRFLRLQVAGPFHSPLIAEAAERFAPALEAVHFKDPLIPLFSNVTGSRIRSGAEARQLALRQITEPVRWTDEEEAIAGLEVDAILEVGPGRTLQGLWKDTGSAIPCLAAGTVSDISVIPV